MLIPLGILDSSGGAAGSFELITSTILTGSQASVTFDVSTYASTYKHLQVRAVVRSAYGSSYDEMYMRFNSDTTSSNYKSHLLYGTGSGVGSAVWSNTSSGFRIADHNASSSTSNAFTPVVADLLDPFSTSKNKTIRTLSGTTTTPFISLASGLWMSTAAVTSIVVSSYNNSFVAGSRFSLYGIKG